MYTASGKKYSFGRATRNGRARAGNTQSVSRATRNSRARAANTATRPGRGLPAGTTGGTLASEYAERKKRSKRAERSRY